MRRAREHTDIGAGAEHRGLPERSSTTFTDGMLEAQPLDRVSELDIDAEVVGVELQLIALEQPALLVHVHGERGDLAVDRELPVPVARRIGLEIDPRLAVGELSSGVSHDVPQAPSSSRGPSMPSITPSRI